MVDQPIAKLGFVRGKPLTGFVRGKPLTGFVRGEAPYYYVTDFICTYNKIDDYDDSLMLYRIQLLQAFNLLEFDDTIVNKITEDIYQKYKDNEYILNLLKSQHNDFDNLNDFNDLDSFRSYFRYDTFFLFHYILCSLVNNKEINEEYYKELLNIKIILDF
jgi:hypothetical protein